tara:strand:- start:702 stop:842 length:141 start_codon:yes stop_codon:yes gene_type:complete
MKKIEKINYSFLARDAREVSEYAQLLVGFTYVDPVEVYTPKEKKGD